MKGRENIWSNLVISNSSCLLSVSVCSMLSSVHCCRFQSLLPKRTELWPSQLYWRNYKETPFNSWAGKREEEVLSDRWDEVVLLPSPDGVIAVSSNDFYFYFQTQEKPGSQAAGRLQALLVCQRPPGLEGNQGESQSRSQSRSQCRYLIHFLLLLLRSTGLSEPPSLPGEGNRGN